MACTASSEFGCQLAAAVIAKAAAFAVGVSEGVAEMHHAAGVGTVPQPEGVAIIPSSE